jgi:hypothetical protein
LGDEALEQLSLWETSLRPHNEIDSTIEIEDAETSIQTFRRFRPRTAVQQQPYTMDSKQYHQQLQGRGMKPVRVIDRSQAQNYESHEEDEAFSPDEASQPRVFDSSSPRFILPRTRTISTELSSINGGSDPETSNRATKRRKIISTSPISPGPSSGNFHSGKGAHEPHSDIFDFTGSPVPVVSWTPVRFESRSTMQGDVQPRAISKSDAPSTGSTPMVQSASRRQSPRTIVSESESGEEEDPTRSFGRRLAGVLPRSWIKLDMEAQKRKDQAKARQAARRSNVKPRNIAGVARVVSTIQKTNGLHSPAVPDKWLSIDNEDDSSSSETPVRPVNDLVEHAMNLSDPGSEMEYDSIDYMRPAAQRSKVNRSNLKPRPRKHQQPRLYDYFEDRERSNHTTLSTSIKKSHKTPISAAGTEQTNSNRPQQQRKLHLSTKKRPSAASRLSVLDISDGDVPEAQIPTFIKIARRQARNNFNLGRHSPTNKFIQLRSREDTIEANTFLEQWRKGYVKPNATIRPKRSNVNPTNFSTLARKPSNNHDGNARRTIRTNASQIVRRNNQPHVSQIVVSNNPLMQAKPAKQRVKKVAKPFRTAQLESLESDFGRRNKRTAFQQSLRNADQDFSRQRHAGFGLEPQLARYLGKENVPPALGPVYESIENPDLPKLKPRRRLRKGIAKRLAVQNTGYHESDVLQYEETEVFTSTHFSVSDTLQGLKLLYPLDFGILPFPHDPKTHFNRTTFIGSGELYRAITMNHRPLDVANGEANVSLSINHYTWSAWDESMSSDLKGLFAQYESELENMIAIDSSTEQLQHCSGTLVRISLELRKIIGFFTQTLYFSDDIDRHMFVAIMSDCYEKVVATMQKLLTSAAGPQAKTIIFGVSQILPLQLCAISQLTAVEHSAQTDQVSSLFHQAAELCVDAILQAGSNSIQSSVHKNNDISQREFGFGKDDVYLEILVALHLILQYRNEARLSIWTLMNKKISPKIQQTNQVDVLETHWKVIFTICPTLELDTLGVIRIGQRFQTGLDNWTAVNGLLGRVFHFYSLASGATRSLNVYIRTLLKRCHKLIQGWAWYNCESVVATLFDFFAKQKLQPLLDEDLHGSPSFLKLLDGDPILDLEDNDAAFAIFLKIVAVGLNAISSRISPNRYKSLVVRLMPNHSRQYLKEDDIKETDLQALKNNHDLVCTLFWRSPEAIRPRILKSVRDLVHHGLSHQTACQVSIKAWMNLARQQLGHESTPELLPVFVAWMKDAIDSAVSHYRMARNEASAFCYKDMDQSMSKHIESLVQRNQKSVRVVFGDAAYALKVVLKIGKSQKQVVSLIKDSGITQLLSDSLWDSTSDNSVLIGIFDVIRVFLNLPMNSVREISQDKDESQDYGDFSFDAFSLAFDQEPDDIASLDFLELPIRRFLSNYLGQDKSALESSIKAGIDLWVNILQIKVNRGMIKWTDVLHSSGQFSWDSFLETDVKRKFTAYFYSAVLAADPKSFHEDPQKILSAWLASLVERRSKMKFQDMFTSALINLEPQPELLYNLPFAKQAGSKFKLSLKELEDRRPSVISSVFANMQSLRQKWQYSSHLKSLLREMMTAMKRNYQELGPNEHSRGAYVDFVHQVVGFFHQYTEDICPMDTFFLKELPLPTNDKDYVAAKLKGYGNKVSDESKIQRLAYYLWSLCERAALDNGNEELVGQIIEALEEGKPGTAERNLKLVLVGAIFPGYISSAFESQAGWIVCGVVLRVLRSVMHNLLYTLDSSQPDSFQGAEEVLQITLAGLHGSALKILDNVALLTQASILRTLNLFLQVVTESLSCLDYVQKVREKIPAGEESIRFFQRFTMFCAKYLLGLEPELLDKDLPGDFPPRYDSARRTCGNIIQSNLQKFKLEGDNYYLMQAGGQRKALVTSGLSYARERAELIQAIEGFHHVFQRVFDE